MICSHLSLHGSNIQVAMWVRSGNNTWQCLWWKSDSNRVEQNLSRVGFASLGCSKCISFQRTLLVHANCLVAAYMSHLFRWDMMVQDARVVCRLFVGVTVYMSQLWAFCPGDTWWFKTLESSSACVLVWGCRWVNCEPFVRWDMMVQDVRVVFSLCVGVYV